MPKFSVTKSEPTTSVEGLGFLKGQPLLPNRVKDLAAVVVFNSAFRLIIILKFGH